MGGMIYNQAVAASLAGGVNPPTIGPVTSPAPPGNGWYSCPITSASTAPGANASVTTPWGTLSLPNFTGSTITSAMTAYVIGSGTSSDFIVAAH